MAKEETTKKPARKAAAKPAAKAAAKPAVKKPAAKKAAAPKKVDMPVEAPIAATESATVREATLQFGKPTISGGRYVFATGRRKTAVANIRLFSGSGKSTINKKPVEQYFGHNVYRDEL